MGLFFSKDWFSRKGVLDEACSNTSLSRLRYIAVEKPKWKVFGKRELRPIPTYNMRGKKGCPCGSTGPCKQKITPKGVVIHYPQRNRFFSKRYKPPKIAKGYLTNKNREVRKVEIVKPKKFPIPSFRADTLHHITPFENPFYGTGSTTKSKSKTGFFRIGKQKKPEKPEPITETTIEDNTINNITNNNTANNNNNNTTNNNTKNNKIKS